MTHPPKVFYHIAIFMSKKSPIMNGNLVYLELEWHKIFQHSIVLFLKVAECSFSVFGEVQRHFAYLQGLSGEDCLQI